MVSDSRSCKWACGILLAALFGCAGSLTPAKVAKTARAGDVEGLLSAWTRAEDDAVRIAVLEGFAQHPEPRGRAILVAQAEAAPTEPVRLAAVRALERHEGPEVTRALVQALGHPWPAVREVAKASARWRDEAASDALLEAAAGHGSPLVRAAALSLLSGHASASPLRRGVVEARLAESARRDDAPRVREEAARGLGRLGVAGARGLLLELVRTDPDPAVRIAAERALQRLGPGVREGSAVVAVLPLRNRTGQPELERFGEATAEYVAARLAAAQACTVVDRAQLGEALAELRKQGSALWDGDAPNAPELGRFMLANQLVFGSIQRQGLVYTIVLGRMDVSTLALVPGGSATASGYAADLDRLRAEVTDRLLAGFR